MNKINALDRLIKALKVLPNVGPKTAQRMAYQLLQHNRADAAELAAAIQHALQHVHHCRCCNTLCEEELCAICADENRDQTRLMIVQMPADVASMEEARCHDGVYFVLMGQVNPTQGMDLSHISPHQLLARLESSRITEIIIATNFTAEGDATAYVLAELLSRFPLKISRLSRGMPLGAELEYVDSGTLAQAVYERRQINHT
ncbi:recombination mediator RecR [Stenoxybacter acetivorans]|uniref:recombination mediator RecR n=1 Tax=Stenoxybacter acetivorans TaxID=422441 RepID=UPI0005617A9C|nr:recombination mediator RecR [Stenoxybacter acetivorans]